MREPIRDHNEPDQEFYESMPATADGFFQADAPAEHEAENEQPGFNEIKTTAIITIVLTIIVAIGLSLLILRALELMRSVTPM